MKYPQLYILTKEAEKNYLSDKGANSICITLNSEYFHKEKECNSNFIDPEKTAKDSEEIVYNVEKSSKEIINSIKGIDSFKHIQSLDELLGPYLYLRLSSYFYIYNILPNEATYLLFLESEWVSFQSKEDLIIAIEKKLTKTKGSFYRYLESFVEIDYDPIKRLMGFIQRVILKYYFQKNEVYYLLSCSKGYFIDQLKYFLLKNKKKVISYYPARKNRHYIYSLYKLLVSTILPNRFIKPTFFILPINKNKDTSSYTEILERLKEINTLPKQYLNKLGNDINKYLVNTLGFLNYTDLIINKTIIRGTFHTTRFPDLYALSTTLVSKKCKTYLISHGTHTKQKKFTASFYSSYQLSLGSLFTKTPSVIHCSQSTFSDDYLSLNGYSFVKIKPMILMQNQLNSKSINIISNSKVNPRLKILYASTIKELGSRTFIYESSYEYIYSLQKLCSRLSLIQNQVKLVVRIRFDNEIKYKFLSEIIEPYKDFVKISKGTSFINDLVDSNCLISLSSTTLEEAINLGKPVMSYGMTNYDHFACYENYVLPKSLDQYHILSKVEELLGRNFVYLKEPLKLHRQSFLDLITDQ